MRTRRLTLRSRRQWRPPIPPPPRQLVARGKNLSVWTGSPSYIVSLRTISRCDASVDASTHPGGKALSTAQVAVCVTCGSVAVAAAVSCFVSFQSPQFSPEPTCWELRRVSQLHRGSILCALLFAVFPLSPLFHSSFSHIAARCHLIPYSCLAAPTSFPSWGLRHSSMPLPPLLRLAYHP